MLIFAVHPVATDATHKITPAPTSVAVIPVRFNSTRLPGKALVDIAGQTMIERVYRRAERANSIDSVLVATDDNRIADVVTKFGGNVCLTRSDHLSGSDRLAEVAESLTCDVIVNVQGDEPLLNPLLIDAVLGRLLIDPSAHIATARCAITDQSEFNNPHVVKVVVNSADHALYFSRSPIPFQGHGEAPGQGMHRHVGLYCYRRPALLQLSSMEPSPLEQAEALEQLRALENGLRIRVAPVASASPGVDTPEDLEQIKKLLEGAA